MKKKRQRIPELAAPIVTSRFELRPLGRVGAWKMRRRIMADAELRGLLALEERDPGAWRMWRRTRRANGRSRFYHAIIDRASGESIGFHMVFIVPHNTASMKVAIIDRSFWGAGAVVEIRKAVMATFHTHGGIEQFVGSVHSRNYASILNYQKMGFEHTGTHYQSQYDMLRDEPADFVTLSLRGEKLTKMLERWADDTA